MKNQHSDHVDSSGWKQPIASSKDGEPHPAPAPMVQTGDGMKRAVTPDPYIQNDSPVLRNFSARKR